MNREAMCRFIIGVVIAEMDPNRIANCTANDRARDTGIHANIIVAWQGLTPTGGKRSKADGPETGLVCHEGVARLTINASRNYVVEERVSLEPVFAQRSSSRKLHDRRCAGYRSG